MMMKVVRVVVALVALTALAGAPAFAQGPAPGPEHEALKEMVGTWDATINFGGQESKGTMVYKMDLGNLWLIANFEGDFFGQKFQGKGADSYDAIKQKYVGVWIDSMTTIPMIMEGTYDKEKRTMTMAGEGRGMDGKPVRTKSVTQMKDKDTMVFTMSHVDTDGKDQQMMTITYKRKG